MKKTIVYLLTFVFLQALISGKKSNTKSTYLFKDTTNLELVVQTGHDKEEYEEGEDYYNILVTKMSNDNKYLYSKNFN